MHSGQGARRVRKIDKRHMEGIAKSHKPRDRIGSIYRQMAAHLHGIIGNYASGLSTRQLCLLFGGVSLV